MWLSQPFTAEEGQAQRVKLYWDYVFMVSHSIINEQKTDYPIAQIYLWARELAFHLLQHPVADGSMLQYEIDDMRQCIPSEETRHLVLFLALLYLLALQKNRTPMAAETSAFLISYLRPYAKMNQLLFRIYKAESRMDVEHRRAVLMSMELEKLAQEKPDLHQATEVVDCLVNLCEAYGVEQAEKFIPLLKDVNERYEKAFQQQVQKLTEMYRSMSSRQVNNHIQGDWVQQQLVQNQVNGVQKGATGIKINS